MASADGETEGTSWLPLGVLFLFETATVFFLSVCETLFAGFAVDEAASVTVLFAGFAGAVTTSCLGVLELSAKADATDDGDFEEPGLVSFVGSGALAVCFAGVSESVIVAANKIESISTSSVWGFVGEMAALASSRAFMARRISSSAVPS